MTRGSHPRASRGIALITVLLAMVVLTMVVAAAAAAVMAESALAFDQVRGQQALAVAEAGAYRALAELRRRIAIDLNAQVQQPTTAEIDIRHICQSADPSPPDPRRTIVEIITNYAHPTGLAATDWTRAGGLGVLRVGTPLVPIRMTDADSGIAIGSFHAAIYVRWSGAPASCFSGPAPEQAVMEFDYAIVAAGRVQTAARTICLRSPNAAPCADWVAPLGRWAGSYELTGGASRGWPVVIVRASAASPPATYAAVRWPYPVPAYQAGDPLYERPSWEELMFR
jgi:Tfp pilus assembly protein PilX